MAFAKLWGPDEDQILAVLDVDSEQEPNITIYFDANHPDFGVCNYKIKFKDSDSGIMSAQKAFNELTEDVARKSVEKIRKSIIE